MTDTVREYIEAIQKIYASGDAREHAYRPAFQKFMESLSDIQAINEPAYEGGNAPDFLFKRADVPIAYAECKDLTVDITAKDVQKQAHRYVEAFGKILLTNYLEFQIIHEETEHVETFRFATLENGTIIIDESAFESSLNQLKNYLVTTPRTIKSAKRLAQIMASKGRILKDNALASLSENPDSAINAQYQTFKQVLIRDLSAEDFADMYAQTLVYGLFVARYVDPTLPTFSRQEAQELLPASNPLLKKFFGHVAGLDYDPKIAWLVDSLIEAFLATDVYEIMHREFQRKQKDPVLHFYETFLSEYDQRLRKSRGVYYTPDPVVSYIVRSIDQILQDKFHLPEGLADTSKVSITRKVQASDARTKDGYKQIKQDVHKVQILDPAVGTGTFLNEVVHHIAAKYADSPGLWQPYAQEHLLPRLHGFELMMASYTMAHLKLGITLRELGYTGDERLNIYLTNSLEEGLREVPNLFMSQWLSEESSRAAKVKNEMPVMVILGNPPYSGVSSNTSDSATAYADKYKIEPGAKQKLQERKHWLNDDYVKFISFAETQIDKTGYGVLGYITPHGYLDNPTFRGMRWHLLKTFDEIYVLDLHGNSNKKEQTPDGGKDENVFDIQQGVSIILAIKTHTPSTLAKVYHSDLYGKRQSKYDSLNELSFRDTPWQEITYQEPHYFFVQKDYEKEVSYKKGVSLADIFRENVTGIVTARDHLVINFSEENLLDKINILTNPTLSDDSVRSRLFPNKSAGKYLAGDTRGWKLAEARNKISNLEHKEYIEDIQYRPLDTRKIYYHSDMVDWGREEVMQHFLKGENIGLNFSRQAIGDFPYSHVLISEHISDNRSFYSSKGINQLSPLYLYLEDGSIRPNLDTDQVKLIEKQLGMSLDWEAKLDESHQSDAGQTFTPTDLLDYIYAVLHTPSYREKYQEFLKIDFPRVPFDVSHDEFWRLVSIGTRLRRLHLMDSPETKDLSTPYPVTGDNHVAKKFPQYKDSKVYINDTQYFDNVPREAWEFYIGGYQPAQKWLKDRRERELTFQDIRHYQQIIATLTMTGAIMEELDKL